MNDIEKKVIDDFGNEWKKFNQNSNSFSFYEIKKMLNDENFIDIIYSKKEPFWCVLGIKK